MGVVTRHARHVSDGDSLSLGGDFVPMHLDLRVTPNRVILPLRMLLLNLRRASMRKLLVAIAVILGVGLFIGSAVVPTPAQPIDCSKTRC